MIFIDVVVIYIVMVCVFFPLRFTILEPNLVFFLSMSGQLDLGRWMNS